MKFWRKLRWQLVAAQLAVVLVGVVVLAWAVDLMVTRQAGTTIPPLLEALRCAESPAALQQSSAAVLAAFRAAVNTALLVAALAAAGAGLLISLVLIREILRPLHAIAGSSQRIAAGHYAERVALPHTSELAALADSFNQMAAALEEIESQRVELIGNVAHELRTPLTGLEGYLEGLIDGVFPATPETFAEMQDEVRRLRRLIDDLQTLSRVETGQVTLHFSSVDLPAAVQRVVARLQPQAEAGGLQLQLGPLAPLQAQADPDRLAQILINLIGNALRYTPEGGRIMVQLRADEYCAYIDVIDNGIGIPPADLPYLFERFYRVDRSRARASGGSGIGLTIARHLAWAMGGEISAASEGPGKGSTFTLTLARAG